MRKRHRSGIEKELLLGPTVYVFKKVGFGRSQFLVMSFATNRAYVYSVSTACSEASKYRLWVRRGARTSHAVTFL